MSQTIKVGIFMTVALVLAGWLILKIEDWNPFGDEGKRVDAVFDSVVGLDDKAAVRVAGVRVGRVDGIRLQGRKARVTLLIDRKLVLTHGAEAEVANQGLLGDKFIELFPGPEDAAPLAEGEVLPGHTPISFDQAMAKIESIGTTIESALGGIGGERGGGVGKLIESLQQTSDELRGLIAENRSTLGGTMRNFERFSADLADNLPRLTDKLDKLLGQVDAVVAENRGNLSDSLQNVKQLTSSVQRSVDNLNTITDKIASGEGTIGKLVNSDQAHDELLNALGSVEKGVTTLSDTLGRVQKLKLDIGMEGYYLSESKDARSAVRLDLLPRGDESPRVYRFELVGDPRGRLFEKTDTVTVTEPDGTTGTTTTTRLTRDLQRNKFTALAGVPFDTRRGHLWAGLIENTGGVQVDYGIVPNRFWLAFEAYDFSRELELEPHLRLTARWFPWKGVYFQAGYDDPLVGDFRSPFVGAGVRWSDDDLKYLLGSIPKF
jgi:phospholipid/cholesterol/gamma-HCH transport system substrate-binding protein